MAPGIGCGAAAPGGMNWWPDGYICICGPGIPWGAMKPPGCIMTGAPMGTCCWGMYWGLLEKLRLKWFICGVPGMKAGIWPYGIWPGLFMLGG